MPNKMMDNPIPFFHRGSSRANNGFSVKLTGIGGNNFRLQPLCQRNTERRFPYRCRTGNNNKFALLCQGLKFYIITQLFEVFLIVEILIIFIPISKIIFL